MSLDKIVVYLESPQQAGNFADFYRFRREDIARKTKKLTIPHCGYEGSKFCQKRWVTSNFE